MLVEVQQGHLPQAGTWPSTISGMDGDWTQPWIPGDALCQGRQGSPGVLLAGQWKVSIKLLQCEWRQANPVASLGMQVGFCNLLTSR